VQTIWNQVPRNDDGGLKSLDEHLSIFSYPWKKLSKRFYRKQLSHVEMQIAHNYVIFNFQELRPYLE
jgi:hypothetical protein